MEHAARMVPDERANLMKRKLNLEQLRKLVLARKTKGEAFMNGDYKARQNEVSAELATMSREDIFAKYPHLTYDVRS